ncbi:hypothetical protein CC78DRAFT_533080 [Lojkania enalia]|uniref:Uncharacterized protein n=1 Tax=Lojkania enalia TaxID=147567 RepID=A0A9P4KAZ9_9PLEO|nr:hypothetical protein CC78DRAFT_533080 [Didymosphaeria enalia]
MTPQPPSFGSQQYWNQRFTANSNPFEWLESPTALDPYLVGVLKETSEQNLELLHIGCGTSLLSYHLRAHVKRPEQIHNLDYSEVAIGVGRKREVEIFNVEERQKESDGVEISQTTRARTQNTNADNCNSESAKPNIIGDSKDRLPSPTYMRWSAADLLSHSSLLNVCKPSAYSIIVDKSTSDSIACAEDKYVPLPYSVSISSDHHIRTRFSESPEPIHPLHILAIHLALLAKPKARWISLSYSEDRYPFLHLPLPGPSHSATASVSANVEDDFDELDDDLDDIPQQVIDSGLPDPSSLWKLESKYEIEVPQQIPPNGNPATHRPKILHWVYVLQRTDIELYVRN